jgi:peptide/nickel transport system permease protein
MPGPIARFVLVRLIYAAVTLLTVSAVVFLALEVLPGDIATRVLGRNPNPEALAALRERFGLDDPAAVRYLRWLGGVATGDFGQSMISGREVTTILAEPLRNTLVLSGAALAIYVPVAFGIATAQALNRGRGVDHILSLATLIVAAIPDFLIATGLLLFVAMGLGIFPVRSPLPPGADLGTWLLAVALPAVTLAVVMAVYAIRILRESLIDALNSEHVRAAELRGLGPRRVLMRYALPTALVPAINVTALNMSYLIGGVVIVEKVFSYPGFGSLAVDAFQQRDLPLIEAAVLVAAAMFIAVNLMADLLALILNPRLRETRA